MNIFPFLYIEVFKQLQILYIYHDFDMRISKIESLRDYLSRKSSGVIILDKKENKQKKWDIIRELRRCPRVFRDCSF